MTTLTADFYLQPTAEVAKALLGTYLVHYTPEGITAGKIVETEAYLADDHASHSFRGVTARNAAMFKLGGTIYVYQIYGIHYCFNTVTGPIGSGEAVLIRALEPTTGIPLMIERRGTISPFNLCSGPAKLVQALGISLQQNGASLFEAPLLIQKDDADSLPEIISTTRIGIQKAAEAPLRFYIKNSPYTSMPLKSRSKISNNLQSEQ